MITNGICKESCSISMNELTFLEISYYNFFGNIKNGQMVFLNKIAQNVINIF